MKVVFVSNYFNHHQKPFCEAMLRLLNDEFLFVSTTVMREERKALGYVQDNSQRYILLAYEGNLQMKQAMSVINEADVVIIGSAPNKMVSSRIRAGKLTFRYSERPYKENASLLRKAYHFFRWRINDFSKKNVYMLCAGGYTAGDYASVGMYRNRVYKWGYFPAVHMHDMEELRSRKQAHTLLWCGRLIDWKHPDDALEVAKKLKLDGYDFHLNMIGIGPMDEELKQRVIDNNLAENVHFLGSMSPERVRNYMEMADIYLFTSDRKEGWGAVLNEAMNSRCAVVASHAAGATPFLIHDKENGLIYQSGNTDDLYRQVKYLLDHPTEAERMGKKAYETVTDLWNAELAAERLINLLTCILNGEDSVDLYESGPCSKAEMIKDDGFKG